MNAINEALKQHSQLTEQLFNRGYLITDSDLPPLDSFPFLGMYSEHRFGKYQIRAHKNQRIFFTEFHNSIYLLIGNCVNPFRMEISEAVIISNVAELDSSGRSAIPYINELTGSFFIAKIQNDKVSFLTDPAGMLFGCYGFVEGKLYISSHAQLIADICLLKKSDYICRLERYRYFRKYGLFFPGDLTQYTELKRILQNHITTIENGKTKIKRFYPNAPLPMVHSDQEYAALVDKVAGVLKNTLCCIAKKYSKPAISLTGGMDSKTTLACANGLYDKFFLYSYITMKGDKPDADAAHSICLNMKLQHTVYTVPENDDEFELINPARLILEHNNGGYAVNDNDVRKREFLRQLGEDGKSFDVEVKSWVSEVARANYYKKFGLRRMPKRLTPKHMASMYKVFLTERKLFRETNSVFKEFIEKTGFDAFPDGYDNSDMYLWEFRYSAWGGLTITAEHSYSNEIFIPYNNRMLLDLMLQAPLEKRRSDQFHSDIIAAANPKVDELGITITNWNETKTRMYIEKAYFLINSHLPF